VAYHVEFTELVRGYLQQVEELTDADRAAIVDGVIHELSRDTDKFHALYPLAHESLCFVYDYPHLTANGIVNFWFVVDASHVEMGVMRVAYVEHTVEPLP
jgi:hypothetical protein